MYSACAHTSGIAEPLGSPGNNSTSGIAGASQTCSGNRPPGLVCASIVASNRSASSRCPAASA